jgi:hypothetical protein
MVQGAMQSVPRCRYGQYHYKSSDRKFRVFSASTSCAALALCAGLILFSADTPARVGMLVTLGGLLVWPTWIAVRGARERRLWISLEECHFSVHRGGDVIESTQWGDVSSLHNVAAAFDPYLHVTNRVNGRSRRIYYQLKDVSHALVCIASSVTFADDIYTLPLRVEPPPLWVEKGLVFCIAAALPGMGLLAFLDGGGAALLWFFGLFSALLVASTISKRRSEPDAISVSHEGLILEFAQAGYRTISASEITKLTFRPSRIRRIQPVLCLETRNSDEIELDVGWVDPVRLCALLVREGAGA